ncbi:DUF1330 domain-containing protein [Salinispora arenicola]|uniref:DUF1330 domain-containing protein n=1 Tax=Salinispora arenicola TaxID=168697 RepID=UPI00036BC905|nr:DUF1330 domain-containing protein [Salinispora arenicola]NIL42465.1 DUF1330 domain-containing protein [Salinispora arenicola]
MAALLIGNVGTLGDPEAMAEYRATVGSTLALHGGWFVIRNGKFDVLEGIWRPDHLSVMGFPSAEQAHRWYRSPEYREIVPLRAGTHMDLILVEGQAV